MADSILTATEGRPSPYPGVSMFVRWCSDIYEGPSEALIAAGLISEAHLRPQFGRPYGNTAFLPGGEPCPPQIRAWRLPGAIYVRLKGACTYSVEVVAPRDVQRSRLAQRREARAAERQEREQRRINDAIAKNGHRFGSWKLSQRFEGGVELWEGTKAQLQAAGLGVGMLFPGEPGAPNELVCFCPLGFKFSIKAIGSYEPLKAAAGIYMAASPVTERFWTHPKRVPFAPGVRVSEWTPTVIGVGSDHYYGTEDALLAAGIVPDRRYFPGHPGANRVQASFREDWCGGDGSIVKCGKKSYCVRVRVSATEERRREQLQKESEAAYERQCGELAGQRMQLRRAARPGRSVEEFREGNSVLARAAIRTLQNLLDTEVDGWRYSIPKGSDMRDELIEAFDTIERAFREAAAIQNGKHAEALQTSLKLRAARGDKGLQAVLREASSLRLMRGVDGHED